jgi:hypothetical protein
MLRKNIMISRTLRLLTALLAVLLLVLPADSPARSKKSKKPFNKKDWIWQPDAFPTEKKPQYIRMADNFFIFYDPSTAMDVADRVVSALAKCDVAARRGAELSPLLPAA